MLAKSQTASKGSTLLAYFSLPLAEDMVLSLIEIAIYCGSVLLPCSDMTTEGSAFQTRFDFY